MSCFVRSIKQELKSEFDNLQLDSARDLNAAQRELQVAKAEIDRLNAEQISAQESQLSKENQILKGKLDIATKRVDSLREIMVKRLMDFQKAIELKTPGGGELSAMRSLITDNADLAAEILPMQYYIVELEMSIKAYDAIAADTMGGVPAHTTWEQLQADLRCFKEGHLERERGMQRELGRAQKLVTELRDNEVQLRASEMRLTRAVAELSMTNIGDPLLVPAGGKARRSAK